MKLKTLVDRIVELEEALRPFANVIYNDNGDVEYDYSRLSHEHYWNAYKVLEKKCIL